MNSEIPRMNGSGVAEGKVCPKCRDWKPKEYFYTSTRRITVDGLEFWCKKCQLDYKRKWAREKRQTDKAWRKTQNSKQADYQRLKFNDQAWCKNRTMYYNRYRVSRWLKCICDYGGRCQRCGEYPRPEMYSTASFTFHHVTPTVKTKSGHRAVQQLDYAELDKCCLLCANCHFLLESTEAEATFTPRAGGRGYAVKEWWWTEDSWFYEGGTRHPGAAFK